MDLRILFALGLLAAVLWAAGQPAQERGEFIVGIDAHELMRATFGAGLELSTPKVARRGLRYILMKHGRPLGGVVIGVFSDRESAIAALEEHVTYTSVGPDEDLSGELGEKSVAWGATRGIFQRDNAVIALSLRGERVQPYAKAIDEALMNGGQGVRRGKHVLMPRIVDVDCPEKVLLGARVKVRVRVLVPQEAFGDYLAFADRRGIPTGYLVPVDLKRQIEVVRTFQYNAPRGTDQAGQKTFWVCYATARSVVVSRRVHITVTAP